MRRISPNHGLLLVAVGAICFLAADWTRFRGSDGSGVATESGTPSAWTATDNVAWKTELPGFGSSSPITLGSKIFLTAYSGYGLDQDNPGDQERLQYHLLCLDRSTGKVVWARGIEPQLPETEYRGFVALHGYTSCTPATDGEAVYAFFGQAGVVAFDLAGKPLWRTYVGEKAHNWGSGASPVVYEDLVIVNASVESNAIVALNKATGEEVWRLDDIELSWSTPLVARSPAGRPELVVSMKGKILGINPGTGEKLWGCAGVADYVCPAVIAHDGVAYITGGRKPMCMAVRLGGQGNVTDTHILWRTKQTPKVATPLYCDGYLYWINQRGIAACIDAADGSVVHEQRLKISGAGDKVYASLVLADGKLFGVTRRDGTVVLEAQPRFEELGRNHLGDDSVFNATPAASNGQLLIRSDRFLYCIGGH